MRLQRYLLTLVLVVAATTAWAQSVGLNTVARGGTISANGGSVELTTIVLGGGFGSAKLQTLDSFSGTVKVICAANGVDYDLTNPLKLNLVSDNTLVTSVASTVGTWDIQNASGCLAIKVQATAGFAASDTTVVLSAAVTTTLGALLFVWAARTIRSDIKRAS